MENGMEELYELFQKAPDLGSLIDPSLIKPDSFTASFNQLKPVLTKVLNFEKGLDNFEAYTRGVLALGITSVAKLLDKKYTLITTNLPFLGSGKMDEILYNYCQENYRNSKSDLATVFIERLQKLLEFKSSYALISPHNWMLQKNYKKLRESLLKQLTYSFITIVGPKGFSTAMYDFSVVLMIVTNDVPKNSNIINGIDLYSLNNPKEKEKHSKSIMIRNILQASLLNNKDCRITFLELNKLKPLSYYSEYGKGSVSGDRPHYIRFFWEIKEIGKYFKYWLNTPNSNDEFSGRSEIILWSHSDHVIQNELGFRHHGHNVYDKVGLALSKVNQNNFTFYQKSDILFDDNTAVVALNNIEDLIPFVCYVKSGQYFSDLKQLDSRLAVTAGTLVDTPFDIDYWRKYSKEKYPNGFPNPYSDNLTQWLFHGDPRPSKNSLQVALYRLLGYQWPAEKDEEMNLAEEARQYIKEILAFNHLADEDGIVCIPSVNGEQPAAERLRDYIREIWKEDWENNTISNLLKQAGSKKTNLEQWLREEFFEQHIKLFHNRPFIWHIWDGRKDGFSTLVNYHKLDKAHLQRLIYTYLGDWIRQCEIKVRDNESGADGLLMAAKKLKEQLILILEGEPPYDIFVRWKPLEKQPIGWEPDINDGVRLNIYPFMQAGILRKKPNIKWGKDRGKNPPGTSRGPDRYNRYEELEEEYKLTDDKGKIIPHLTNKIKRKARESVNATL